MAVRTWPPLPGVLHKADRLLDAEETLAECVLTFVRVIGGVWTVARAGTSDVIQRGLYAMGRTKPGRPCGCSKGAAPVCPKHPLGRTVTEAPDASKTPHGFRLVNGKRRACAVDLLALTLDGKSVYEAHDRYDALGEFVEEAGFRWGGKFRRYDVVLKRRVPFYDGGHVERADYRDFPPAPAAVVA